MQVACLLQKQNQFLMLVDPFRQRKREAMYELTSSFKKHTEKCYTIQLDVH
jgi:hypothetical protein